MGSAEQAVVVVLAKNPSVGPVRYTLLDSLPSPRQPHRGAHAGCFTPLSPKKMCARRLLKVPKMVNVVRSSM